MLPRLFPHPGATNHHTHASSGWGSAPLEIYSRLSINEAQEEYNSVIGRFPI